MTRYISIGLTILFQQDDIFFPYQMSEEKMRKNKEK